MIRTTIQHTYSLTDLSNFMKDLSPPPLPLNFNLFPLLVTPSFIASIIWPTTSQFSVAITGKWTLTDLQQNSFTGDACHINTQNIQLEFNKTRKKQLICALLQNIIYHRNIGLIRPFKNPCFFNIKVLAVQLKINYKN